MKLTTQERLILIFLACTLALNGIIYLVKENHFIGGATAEDSATADSLFVAKVALAESLVAEGVPSPPEDPEVQQMVEVRKTFQVDVNRASLETLQQLPRIGPAMAKRIIAHRRKNGYFRTLRDLEKVKGIGPATIEKLRPYVLIKPDNS